MNTDLIFPKFDDEQMGHASTLGERRTFSPGEVLIKSGQKNYPFFVFESGEVEILEVAEEGATLIATHGPRAFSGDVDMLTDALLCSQLEPRPMSWLTLCPATNSAGC